ncbi:MAG TPA: hypothetical protein VEH86_05215 [Candidatus Acidoferrum sp.]|nr:hypothetical protein [Candidatus Acidoferrum sp.]
MEEKTRTRNSGVNHLAFGSIILGWGILIVLKEIGIIEESVSTWPFAFTAFGAVLVAAGVIKLNRSRHVERSTETN